MSTSMRVLVTIFAISSVHAANDAEALDAMQEVFARSDRVHSESMAAIAKSMTPQAAWQVLEKNNLTTPALIAMASDLHGNHAHLRKQPKGYSGLEGARKLLNDMIFESISIQLHCCELQGIDFGCSGHNQSL